MVLVWVWWMLVVIVFVICLVESEFLNELGVMMMIGVDGCCGMVFLEGVIGVKNVW